MDGFIRDRPKVTDTRLYTGDVLGYVPASDFSKHFEAHHVAYERGTWPSIAQAKYGGVSANKASIISCAEPTYTTAFTATITPTLTWSAEQLVSKITTNGFLAGTFNAHKFRAHGLGYVAESPFFSVSKLSAVAVTSYVPEAQAKLTSFQDALVVQIPFDVKAPTGPGICTSLFSEVVRNNKTLTAAAVLGAGAKCTWTQSSTTLPGKGTSATTVSQLRIAFEYGSWAQPGDKFVFAPGKVFLRGHNATYSTKYAPPQHAAHVRAQSYYRYCLDSLRIKR